MKHLFAIIIFSLFLFPALVSAAELDLNTPELAPLKSYLDRQGMFLTPTAADAQKAGYILVTGSGKGPRLAAQRAATVDAQRAIAALLADMPGKSKKPVKQVTQTSTETRTIITGNVKRAVTIFKQYDTSHQTMYLLMRKDIPQHP